MIDNQAHEVKRKMRRGGMDGQQKEAILTEEKIRKKWDGTWGLLNKNEILKVYREVSEEHTGDPEFLFNRKHKNKSNKEQKFNILPSPSCPPCVSSKLVGWRADTKYSLEIAGPFYTSPRHTMIPPGEMDDETYRNIFLG